MDSFPKNLAHGAQSFGGGNMIIDVHLHVGYDVVFNETVSEEEVISAVKKNKVDKIILQPLCVEPLVETQRKAHDQVAAMCSKYPNTIYGMASLTPQIGRQYYMEEVERCIRHLGFVGIKLNPLAHAADPMSPSGGLPFEAAHVFKVPVMVHTGPGIPFSLPCHIIPRAREFPDVPIILAHAGLIVATGEAAVLAQDFDNVYLDMSWIQPHVCKAFVKSLGASKLMFASDMWDNQIVELTKWRSLGLSNDDLEQVLWKTAHEVYRI
jgi:predicted TIM-barrel fold metal-dependent hydrolase